VRDPSCSRERAEAALERDIAVARDPGKVVNLGYRR